MSPEAFEAKTCPESHANLRVVFLNAEPYKGERIRRGCHRKVSRGNYPPEQPRFFFGCWPETLFLLPCRNEFRASPCNTFLLKRVRGSDRTNPAIPGTLEVGARAAGGLRPFAVQHNRTHLPEER